MSTAQQGGARAAADYRALADQLLTLRIVWIMVPSGDSTEAVIKALSDLLSPGDIVIDGGNSCYRDSIRRAEILKAKGVSQIMKTRRSHLSYNTT